MKMHTREFFIVMPEVEMKLIIKGKYADVEVAYIRMEALLAGECARYKEEGLRRALGEVAPKGQLGCPTEDRTRD